MAQTPRTSGVFSLGALSGDGAASGDANWSDVVLLLDFEGQSVTDHSGNATNLTVGSGSNTSGGTAVYGSGANAKNGSYSFHSSGTGSANPYIALADPQLGTGEFTLECWLKVSSANSYANLMTNEQQGTTPGHGFSWQLKGPSGGMLLWNQWASKITGTTNVVDGNWRHVAITRNSSNEVTLWVDGQKDHTNTVTDSGSYSITNSGTSPFLIGHNLFHANRHVAGYIDDVRITKGVCRYSDTANGFTPPSALPQGPAVAGTTRPTRRWGGMTGRSLVASGGVEATLPSSPQIGIFRGGLAQGSTTPTTVGSPTTGGTGVNSYYQTSASDYYTFPQAAATSWTLVWSADHTGQIFAFIADMNNAGIQVWNTNAGLKVYAGAQATVDSMSGVSAGDRYYCALRFDGTTLSSYRWDGTAEMASLPSSSGSTTQNFSVNGTDTAYISQYSTPSASFDHTENVYSWAFYGTDLSDANLIDVFNTMGGFNDSAASTNVPTTGVLSLAEHYQGTL